jgi:hypothetical protein
MTSPTVSRQGGPARAARRHVIFAVMASCLAMLSLTARASLVPAGAAEDARPWINHDVYFREFAYASGFEAIDGCVERRWSLLAGYSSTAGPLAGYSEYMFDRCSPEIWDLVYGSGVPSTLAISPSLSSAHVTVTFPLYWEGGAPTGRSITVDQSWSAEGRKSVAPSRVIPPEPSDAAYQVQLDVVRGVMQPARSSGDVVSNDNAFLAKYVDVLLLLIK